jgi:hypothetical protein
MGKTKGDQDVHAAEPHERIELEQRNLRDSTHEEGGEKDLYIWVSQSSKEG